MAITKPPVLPAWAESGDRVTPSNAEIQVGWPLSSIPPSRQRFNWLLNYLANAVRYFSRRGIPDYDVAETYMIGDRIIGDDGKTYRSLIDTNLAQTPSTSPTKWERWGFSISEVSALKGIQRFTANGSFTIPSGVTTIYVSGCAGGGGGGAGGSSSATVVAAGGGGGGAANSIFDQPFSVTPGQVIPITIGGGGSGGTVNPWGSGGNNGTAGGNTVVGSLLTLTGGGPGGGGGVGASTAEASPQTGFNNGQPGGPAFIGNQASSYGGSGGPGPFGGSGAMSQQPATNGSAAWGYGVGGSGGAGCSTQVNLNGAAGLQGMPGLIIIKW